MRLKRPFSDSERTDCILFFDFDETYYPHACTKELIEDLHELEEYLQDLAHRKNIKIGWVTGSDIQEIKHKMKRANMKFSPHFIASNLGTEVYHINEHGELSSNVSWDKKLNKASFTSSTVNSIVNDLYHQYNIKLVEQTQFKQRKYKWNYYYFIVSEAKTNYDLNIIRHLAKNNGIGLNINHCNPKAGDPDNAFDVDFIPLGTGKSEIVKFMSDFYKVPIEKTVAFGDSGNDIEMLKAVHHGYLLANGTHEAKRLHSKITTFPYAKGIIDILKQIFFN